MRKAEIAPCNGVEIWHETFGEKGATPLLLIHGQACQGILWPIEFCERLVEAGFFVIRFDHRDVGLSTYVDFEKEPYGIADMARDAAGLLDHLGIESAHVAGLSMGGPIAQCLAVEGRARSLTLIATSCDFGPANRAGLGLPWEEGTLPPPDPEFLEAFKVLREAKMGELENRLERCRLLHGPGVPFDEEGVRALQVEYLERQRDPDAVRSHYQIPYLDEELVREVPGRVRVPTLVMHGSVDPLVGPEHGEALAEAIEGAQFRLMEGMGHLIHPAFYDVWVKEIRALVG